MLAQQPRSARPATQSPRDRALYASASTYSAHGFEVRLSPSDEFGSDPPHLYVPELARAEKVETAESLATCDLSGLVALRERGIEIWVLFPRGASGMAHRRMRRAADRIIPYWIDAGQVKFGHPRLP
jgi:hypothetical protein